MTTPQKSSSLLWKLAGLHAVAVSLLVVGLFYYWFAVADRYAVFLYVHLGARPFDPVTRGRYWMAGLVAAGLVMVLSILCNGLAGRLGRGYTAPTGWGVWLLCLGPVTGGILLVTMTQNQPTLPLVDALACVAATWAGLALALMPGRLAAENPGWLVWFGIDSLGLAPPLLMLRALELPGQGLNFSVPLVAGIAVGSILLSGFWLLALTGLGRRRQWPMAGPVTLLVGGCCWSFLFLPLVHHLCATPADYRYITASSNFFASSLLLQSGTFLVVTALAVGVGRWRRYWGVSPGK